MRSRFLVRSSLERRGTNVCFVVGAGGWASLSMVVPVAPMVPCGSLLQ